MSVHFYRRVVACFTVDMIKVQMLRILNIYGLYFQYNFPLLVVMF